MWKLKRDNAGRLVEPEMLALACRAARESDDEAVDVYPKVVPASRDNRWAGGCNFVEVVRSHLINTRSGVGKRKEGPKINEKT
jgi:hypothetical protein